MDDRFEREGERGRARERKSCRLFVLHIYIIVKSRENQIQMASFG